MHKIQGKILNLSKSHNLAGLTLRKIGELIGEKGSPQKIKHHLNKLIEKGLLIVSADGENISGLSVGLDKKNNLISLPIFGSANCGQALELAENNIEDYLRISKKILGNSLTKKIKDLFVLKAVGQSMDRANLNGENIEDGDYLIIDKEYKVPQNGDYVVSVIDGAANIKKFYSDDKNERVVLVSESTQDMPPIYVHKKDLVDYLICGKVVSIVKKINELALMIDVSAKDILKDLGPISGKEVKYYENL